MATMIKSQYPDLLDPIVRKIFEKGLENFSSEYDKIFTVDNTTKATETDSELIGFAAAQVVLEGQNISQDQAYQGYDYTYTPVDYGLGYVITHDMMEDDQSRKIKRLGDWLARSMSEVPELLGANVFNNAFASSGVLYGDGKTLCASDHPKAGGAIGGTLSNLLTMAADLSYTSLKAAITQMRKMKGDRGLYVPQVPSILLIPPDLEFDAQQILNSTLVPGGANNDTNAVKDLYSSLRPFVMTRLTDADAWFLLTQNREKLVFFWRQKPDHVSDMNARSRDVEVNSLMRLTCGASGWDFVLGTPGA